MFFAQPLLSAIFIKRYKRFLIDCQLEDGTIITAHCPNSGSMKSCIQEGWQIKLSTSKNPNRKFPQTFEMIHNENCWIGINTHLANKIVKEAIELKQIEELKNYSSLQTEVKYGKNSRIDILLENDSQKCYVEVKNVTLLKNGDYQFPDAKTKRGQKHLIELMEMVKQNHRSVMFFLVQRNDGKHFRAAKSIDPEYAKLLKKAVNSGVEILVYQADVSPKQISARQKIDVLWS